MGRIIKSIFQCIVISFLIYGCTDKEMYSTWSFVNAPDMHNVEGFSNVWEDAWSKKFDSYEEYREDMLRRLRTDFKTIKGRHDAELLVSPGDCNSARWDDRRGKKFQENFRSVAKYANFSDNEILIEACRLCYTALNEIVYSGGFKEFYMAVGDHELGDNPWPVGSVAPESLPAFREGFANHFTLKEPNGKTRFGKKIGKVNARPIGTIYENTSYAAQYKNILFVTLDVFRFDGKDIKLGEEGLVCGDVEGKHLEWLENVLKQAQEISSIDHIIVQSHLPMIYPVKKYASSGMMMSGTKDNVLLKVLRKYNVDLYLAGEVHMNTVTKDPDSDLVQFVGRGNTLSNYSVVDVEQDALFIKTYKKDGSLIGELAIDKSQSETKVEGDGVLKLIDPEGLQIHWDFDEKLNVNEFNPSTGGNGNPWLTKQDRAGDNAFVLLNNGDFGDVYSLFGVNASLSKGIQGNCIEIAKDTKLGCIAIGPLYADYKRTISAWVKTLSVGRRLILNGNLYWNKTGQFFNVGLNDGQLEISLRPEIYAKTNSANLNDGQWHHIAVVVPFRDAKLSECKLFVDGGIINDVDYKNGVTKIYSEQGNWMSVATQTKLNKIDLAKTMQMENFEGYLDDIAIWSIALNDDNISTLYRKGLKGIGARTVDAEL